MVVAGNPADPALVGLTWELMWLETGSRAVKGPSGSLAAGEEANEKGLSTPNPLVETVQRMAKRIPISENTWKELRRLKEDGQTYDQLLTKMIRNHNRTELLRKMERVEKMAEEELVPPDEL